MKGTKKREEKERNAQMPAVARVGVVLAGDHKVGAGLPVGGLVGARQLKGVPRDAQANPVIGAGQGQVQPGVGADDGGLHTCTGSGGFADRAQSSRGCKGRERTSAETKKSRKHRRERERVSKREKGRK